MGTGSRIKNLAPPSERFAADLKLLSLGNERRLKGIVQAPTPERERESRRKMYDFLREATEIDRELRELNVPFSLVDLSNVHAPYPEAIPVLLRHANYPYSDTVRHEIFRALSVRYAGRQVNEGLSNILRAEYATLTSNMLFRLGLAIAVSATRKEIATLLEIASETRFGTARLEPLLRLARWHDPGVAPIAIKMLRDQDCPFVAIDAARLARVVEAAPLIAPYLKKKDIGPVAGKYFKALNIDPQDPGS